MNLPDGGAFSDGQIRFVAIFLLAFVDWNHEDICSFP